MSFEVMLLIVLGPIVVSALGLTIGLVKKNKIIIIISIIIFLVFFVRAVFIFYIIANWVPFD